MVDCHKPLVLSGTRSGDRKAQATEAMQHIAIMLDLQYYLSAA